MMKDIFMGLFLITLDINVPIGSGALGLLPDFVGYWILWKAMSGRGNAMEKGAFVAQKLMLFSAVVYLLDLLSLTSRFVMVGMIIGCISDMAVCYMQYLTIKEIEEIAGQSQECISKLKAVWFFAALVLLLKYVLLWIPLINILGVMLARVADILFVVMAYCVYKKNGSFTGNQ